MRGPNPQWEYLVDTVRLPRDSDALDDEDTLEALLEKRGKCRWELVTVERLEGTTTLRLYFKQMLPAEFET